MGSDGVNQLVINYGQLLKTKRITQEHDVGETINT